MAAVNTGGMEAVTNRPHHTRDLTLHTLFDDDRMAMSH